MLLHSPVPPPASVRLCAVFIAFSVVVSVERREVGAKMINPQSVPCVAWSGGCVVMIEQRVVLIFFLREVEKKISKNRMGTKCTMTELKQLSWKESAAVIWAKIIAERYYLTMAPVMYQVKVTEFNLCYSGLCANDCSGYSRPRRSSCRWQCDVGCPSRTNRCAMCTDAASWVRADYPIPTTGYIRDSQIRVCTRTSSSAKVNV